MMSVWWVECLHKCIRCRWITQQVSHQQLMTSALLIRGHHRIKGGDFADFCENGKSRTNMQAPNILAFTKLDWLWVIRDKRPFFHSS